MELELDEAREIVRENDAEHLWTEAELVDAVARANRHPTRSAFGLFRDWVEESARESNCETAEAAAAE